MSGNLNPHLRLVLKNNKWLLESVDIRFATKYNFKHSKDAKEIQSDGDVSKKIRIEWINGSSVTTNSYATSSIVPQTNYGGNFKQTFRLKNGVFRKYWSNETETKVGGGTDDFDWTTGEYEDEGRFYDMSKSLVDGSMDSLKHIFGDDLKYVFKSVKD